MNQAFLLYRLQQIDTQIDQAEASLAEVNRLLASDETVRQAQQVVDDAETVLRHSRQTLKEAEFAVREQQIKIGQNEASLYGGRIKNPKELQDLQKELASLKKYLGELEEKQIEAMIIQEEAEAQAQAAEAALTKAQAAFHERSAGWLGQKEQLQRNLDRLRAEREAPLSQVPAQDLKVYETLRKRKSGVAVTTVKEGACSTCGGTFRPAELQQARASQELFYCKSCGRIFYAG